MYNIKKRHCHYYDIIETLAACTHETEVDDNVAFKL